MEKINNLPMSIEKHSLIQKKREQKRIKNNIKRIGKIALNSGIAASGVVIAAIGGPIGVPIGIGMYTAFATKSLYDIAFKKEEGTQFVTKRNLKGEISLFQDALDIRGFSRMKGFEPQEKGALMGIQMLMSLQNYKRQYQDKGIPTEIARDGENQVYPQVFKTVTHGINIKTIEALEKLGYLQIDKNQLLDKKSILFWEKIGFGQYKKAIEALNSVLTRNQDKIKENQVQMSEILFRLTDKPLNLEEIYIKYQDVKSTKDNNPMRKPIRRIGSIIEALKSKNIDIETDEIGLLRMNYNAKESLATRVVREHEIFNRNKRYREEQKIVISDNQMLNNRENSVEDNLRKDEKKEDEKDR